MTEMLLDKPTQLLKGKIIDTITLMSDCIGDMYVIKFTDNTEIQINYNDDRDFWLDIVNENNKCLLQIGIDIIDKIYVTENTEQRR